MIKAVTKIYRVVFCHNMKGAVSNVNILWANDGLRSISVVEVILFVNGSRELIPIGFIDFRSIKLVTENKIPIRIVR